MAACSVLHVIGIVIISRFRASTRVYALCAGVDRGHQLIAQADEGLPSGATAVSAFVDVV